MPVDLAISADAQATLPALIEAVKSATSMSQRAAISERTGKLRDDYRRMKERALAEAAPGWDAVPCSTARVTANLWNTIKNENWCLAVSNMPWSRSLWPATQ